MAATRRLAAIMFTDVVGFTASAQDDESAALTRLREQEKLVRPLLAPYGGRAVKSTGDGFLIEFDSALKAAECAVEIQRRMHERNVRPSVAPIELRIGVHVGDVERRDRDIFGDAVNVAARIVTVAAPGGVCVSGQVFDHLRHKTPYSFEKLPPTTMKGVRGALDVYRIVLPWRTPEPPPHEAEAVAPRLAVLPLGNISPDPKDAYFADGLTEELIAALSKIRGLRVIARTTVGQYKATEKSIAQIGAELGVGTILEGSVRKAGDRIRITLQLIDVARQEPIWSDSYNRELADVFALQAEVAEQTAATLQLRLLQGERDAIHRPPTTNPIAYDRFLQGIAAPRWHTAEGITEAIRCLEEAIAADPGFSLAYAYLSNTLVQASGQYMAGREAFPRARELAAKALALDPESAEAHTAGGNLAMQGDQDWALAERELQTALRKNPSSSAARQWSGVLQVTLQRFDEAEQTLRSAIELDPLWEAPYRWITAARHRRGDDRGALEVARRSSQLFPRERWPPLALALLHARLGERKEASKELKAAGPDSPFVGFWGAYLLPLLGRTEEARSLLRKWERESTTRYVPLMAIAGLHAVLGDTKEALALVERDSREGDRVLWFTYQDEQFDAIRNAPRFQALLSEFRLPKGIARAPMSIETPRGSAVA